MKRVIIHHDAELELWQAVEYYETKCAGLGLDLEQEMSRILADIREAPERWPVKRNGARCCLLHRFPYAVHYVELEDTLWVVAVAHTSRKPYYWRNRLNK
ncbi:MAG: type II toxin-antitoxin system RelE/ParE family toxin [Deltaproteobacteria bacterium]|nr:type II toxin-antitoxin system RelE/ParE family toxin [Deltaproteobacteria bacterium]